MTRWKISEEFKSFASQVNNLFNNESKDGKAMNVQKYSSKLVNIQVGDKAKALSSKELVDQMLRKEATMQQRVTDRRTSLFNKDNEVKSWKANELMFLDQMLDNIKSEKIKLQRCQTNIISNIELLNESARES